MKYPASFLFLIISLCAYAQKENFDADWHFAFGDATSPANDFGCGTEYFNYLTKAASIHNEGPYSPKFEPEKWGKTWTQVTLPHDWVVDLPYSREASHSHGYKTVGHKYPQTSVGWYRKTFTVPNEDYSKHISLTFDGIFRDARVWVNGFYLGNEPSGYLPQVYNISEYLNYGGDNLVCVRVDATLEEGWFYEGAGIYRHVWLNTTGPVHVDDYGTFIHSYINDTFDTATVTIETTVANDSKTHATYTLSHSIIEADGKPVAQTIQKPNSLRPAEKGTTTTEIKINQPELWSIDHPYMYTVLTEVIVDGHTTDSYTTPIGIRSVAFDKDRGFILNGEPVKLKGVNMHQDHAGVGSAFPDALQEYRLKTLKSIGVNAYRCSHNPPTPELLDACDRLGIVVIDENRLLGTSPYQISQLQKLIQRDRNHPSVILWSVGNEEWGVEWNEPGERIVETMRDYCHLFDPTRPMTVASSSGPTVLVPADVAGYNYILQNPVEEHRAKYPERCAVGTEETSGCGTRGLYYNDKENGRMKAINRAAAGSDSCVNCIERGWKFYAERPWLGGLFYWTGFDYRGEPNPLQFPATGSEFGIFDYCGFPKDEAYYLKSWWTDTPVLHILPHWNLKGHEGQQVSVWAYSNCDEVELIVNGKRHGRKKMPVNSHLEWDAVYNPGNVRAIGYKNGKKVIEERIETTDAPANLVMEIMPSCGKNIEISGEKYTFPIQYSSGAPVIDLSSVPMGTDFTICNVTVTDRKGRFVPDACVEFSVTLPDDMKILGWGNGDPAYQYVERPNAANPDIQLTTFAGHAQLLITK